MKTITWAGIADHDCVIKFGSYMNPVDHGRHQTHRNAVPIHETNTVERTENPVVELQNRANHRESAYGRHARDTHLRLKRILTFRSPSGLLSRVYLFVCLFVCYTSTITRKDTPAIPHITLFTFIHYPNKFWANGSTHILNYAFKHIKKPAI
jgi:hypothetical protein